MIFISWRAFCYTTWQLPLSLETFVVIFTSDQLIYTLLIFAPYIVIPLIFYRSGLFVVSSHS
jgi:hypothetical protein